MATWRILRANEILKQEIGTILQEDLDRSPEDLITVTRVEASPDLQHAKVYISILPEQKRKEIWNMLTRGIFDVQQSLNARMRTRPVPKIEWVVEKNMSEIKNIDELFDKIDYKSRVSLRDKKK